jgi:valyl-tRNA synthetase
MHALMHLCMQMLGKAVCEAFVRMYDDGLIYRDNRLVGWCPYLKTALSDIEIENEEIEGPKQISIPGFKHKVGR